MALMVLTGPEAVEAYDSRPVELMELPDGEEERRREPRMLEKEKDERRVERMMLVVWCEVDVCVGM